jgi:hypothetical protein
VTIEIDFEGHGIGRLLVPLFVRGDARREMPDNLRRLKERLEAPAERIVSLIASPGTRDHCDRAS